MNVTDTDMSRAARIAGIMYVVVILLGVLSMNVIRPQLISPGDTAATIRNIMSNEVLFRAGIVSELAMYLLVMVLSISLYVVLKNIGSTLALTALLFRFAEAIVGIGITTTSGVLSLLLLHADAGQPELVQVMLNAGGAGMNVVLVLVGIGGALFCLLFFRSRYIPRLLSGWGMFTYVTVSLIGLGGILVPGLPAWLKIAVFTPGAIFELAIGCWLWARGVNTEHWQATDAHST